MKTKINVVHLDKSGKEVTKAEIEAHIRQTAAQALQTRIKQAAKWEG